MRQFIGGNGVDTTTAVVDFLNGAVSEVLQADLVLIGELEDPTSVFLTNWESPLDWPVWGTFQPASIQRDTIVSQVGLEVASMQFTWSPNVGEFSLTVPSSSPYQLAQAGFYDNKPFRLWRTIMPTPGDANTYGACEWFGGWIGQVEVSRGKIVFTVDSFLSVVNQKLPPNVIESTNTLAGYVGATPVLVDGETDIPVFEVVEPTSANIIIAKCLSPTANKIYDTNKLQYGFLVFEPGSTLAGFWSAIESNARYPAGGGIFYNAFYCYSPFPWVPTPGDTFYASTQFPINLQDGNYYGFPYVPAPEEAL